MAEDPLVDALAQTSFTVIAGLTRLAAEHDLSPTQLRVLAILRDRTPTMAALAGFLGLERSSVSGLVDRAVRRGLVTRTPSAADGRSVTIGLTAEGHRLATTLADAAVTLLTPLTTRLTPAERRRLTALLLRLLDTPEPRNTP